MALPLHLLTPQQRYENLAFQVRIGPLENPEYFCKLIFEFPREYPKVKAKINVLEVQPKDPAIRQRIEKIKEYVTLYHTGCLVPDLFPGSRPRWPELKVGVVFLS